MTHWHADINAATLTSGTTLTVLSQHHVVHLATADTLAIDTIDDQCLAAVVYNRSDIAMTLELADCAIVSLGMLVDESLLPPGENRNPFSRQVWLVH